MSERTPACADGNSAPERTADLAASEARYRALAHAVGQMVWTTAPDGQVADMPEWRAYTGQTPEEVRGWGWLDALHPDDREPARNVARAAVEARTLYDIEYRVRRHDGRHRWWHARAVPVLGPDGELREWVGCCIDIDAQRRTEAALRESEARLAGIIGSAMDAVVTTDESRRIVLFNAAAERLFGVAAAEVLGTSLDRFVPVRYRSAHAVHMQAFGETGTTSRSMHRPAETLPALRADGTEVPVEATISQITIGGRRLLTVMLRDVSERVTAERERERLLAAERAARQEAESQRQVAEEARRAAEAAQGTAEEASRTKSDFLARMSHELRTPLNAIAGHVQLMEMGLHGPITDAQREALVRVSRAERYLLGLINDVLNFARLESGRVEYALKPVRLAEVVAQVLPLVEPQLTAKGISLDVGPPERGDAAALPVPVVAPLLVWADREKLTQVLVNLLTNAAKFTPARGSVRLELADHPDVPDLAFLRVVDTGVGIPAAQLEHVFEPFVQVHRMHPGLGLESQQGTGLGLAISRDLARGMHGDLTAESTLGVGSTFTVTLRRAVTADGELTDRRNRSLRRAVERRGSAARRTADRRSGEERRADDAAS